MSDDHADASQAHAPKGRAAPLPFVGALIEPIYRAAIARINKRFDRGVGVERLPIPVISVGNLSVGGTGKTPTVMFLASLLLEHGQRPCIALRGYRSRAGSRSDEADSYSRALPEVPIVARPDRATGIRELLSSLPAEARPTCVLLDDGFQHRQIARDLDIVLIDASRSVFDDRLLPAGWLREPPESVQRAGAIVVSHAELAAPREVEALAVQLRAIQPSATLSITRHTWTHLMIHERGVDRPAGLDFLLSTPVVGCCAIGHPEAFVRSLANVRVGSSPSPAEPPMLILPDHDPFSPATVRRLVDLARAHRAGAIVVTDKDWSKLRSVDPSIWPCPIVRPQLALMFDSGREDLERSVLDTIARARAQRAT